MRVRVRTLRARAVYKNLKNNTGRRGLNVLKRELEKRADDTIIITTTMSGMAGSWKYI